MYIKIKINKKSFKLLNKLQKSNSFRSRWTQVTRSGSSEANSRKLGSESSHHPPPTPNEQSPRNKTSKIQKSAKIATNFY